MGRFLTAVVVSSVLVAGACGGGGPEPTASGQAVGPEDVLAFSATTVDGDRVDLAELAGQDVLFWFWAPW